MRIGEGLLPQLWLPRLREIELPGKRPFKEWLLEGTYSVASLQWDANGKSVHGFTLQVHNDFEFYAPLTHEINRWASACFESVESINQKPKRVHAIAWPLIQLYYSAFFGAHAVCRAFGVICSQLESKHTAAVRKQSSATLSRISQPVSGLYAVSFNASLRTVTARLLADSHADLWAEFNSLIFRLSSDVLLTIAQSNTKIEASGLFSDMSEILKQGGATRGNWLSKMRNQLNYHKSHGAWYPYNKLNPEISQLLKSINRWQDNKAQFSKPGSRNELTQFIEASTFIIWLCRHIVTELGITRIKDKHFVDRGGLDFLRHAKISK